MILCTYEEGTGSAKRVFAGVTFLNTSPGVHAEFRAGPDPALQRQPGPDATVQSVADCFLSRFDPGVAQRPTAGTTRLYAACYLLYVTERHRLRDPLHRKMSPVPGRPPQRRIPARISADRRGSARTHGAVLCLPRVDFLFLVIMKVLSGLQLVAL